MSDLIASDDQQALTPFGYWQESVAAWQELGERTKAIWTEQAQRLMKQTTSEEDAAETLTRDALRVISDFNLRHWQITARALDSLPAWMTTPKIVDGSAITDWFDQFRRLQPPATTQTPAKPKATRRAVAKARLADSKSASDDLTRIKGIGPKLATQLNELGVYSFKQIATWSKKEAAWIDENLIFRGRTATDAWVSQARKLISNGSATIH